MAPWWNKKSLDLNVSPQQRRKGCHYPEKGKIACVVLWLSLSKSWEELQSKKVWQKWSGGG